MPQTHKSGLRYLRDSGPTLLISICRKSICDRVVHLLKIGM